MPFIVRAYGRVSDFHGEYFENMKDAIKQYESIDDAYSPELFFEDADGSQFKIKAWEKHE